MDTDAPIEQLHPITRDWFLGCFEVPTPAQTAAWVPVQAGESTLLMAPTGSGKTLAAFLCAIDRLLFAPPPESKSIRVLYISPLKALAVDVQRNLRSPLVGIQALAAQRGTTTYPLNVGIRTGDTTQAERARMLRHPPDILITTPESLYLMATSKARELFLGLECVIIDEIHTMVNSKRGAHLTLTLERLEHRRTHPEPLQRIGLSATQNPLEEVGRFLGGYQETEQGSNPRPLTIVDAGSRKQLKLHVEMPADETIEQDPDDLIYGASSDGVVRSSWVSLIPRIVSLVQSHRSSIVFVNSRRTAEKLAAAINEAADAHLAQAHHGSLAHTMRAATEEALKQGQLPAIVATASLELGIDMGAVELVIQVGAFPSVTSGLQRVGRARHHVGGIPEGVSFPKHPADLLASAVVGRAMLDGKIEPSRYPRNPLDVLAQQIAAMIAMDDWSLDTLYTLVRQSAPFQQLPQSMFEGVLDMMSGRYPADDFADLKPTIVWDRVHHTLTARRGLQRLAVVNGGTIADRGLYGVFLYNNTDAGSKRVGELDEEMVFESRVGDVFLLGASSWRIEEITHDRVLVTPAPGVPGKMPFWKGDQMGRSFAVGQEIGQFCGSFSPTSEQATKGDWANRYGLAENAQEQLWDFLLEQAESGGLPTDTRIVVERFIDEIGDWRVCILSPYGTAVHAPWAMAVQAQLMTRRSIEVDTMWSDDGIVFRIADGEHELPDSAFFPEADTVEEILLQRLSETPFFGARFRENAGRSLLLPKRKPGKRSPLWALRRRAASLLKVASEYRDFPIVLETYRECLVDHFNMEALKNLLSEVQDRRIRVISLQSDIPTPFASSLMFQYVANFIYDGDAPLAERRAQALTIDQSKLRELMGEAALRSLLDQASIDEVVAQVQRKTHPAVGLDALHNMLLALGPLTEQELSERYAPKDPIDTDWRSLLQQNRLFRYKTDRGEYYAAVEDAARLRDAIGIVIPVGVPLAFQEPTARPVRDLVRRYCRTHGPHKPEEISHSLGLSVGIVREQLAGLEQEGQVVSGAFSPSVTGQEWCDVDLLRQIKRKALSKLRAEVEAVSPEQYTAFLVQWHHANGGMHQDLLDTVEHLQGVALPSSVLEGEVLKSRIPHYVEGGLDALCASGQVVWIGTGSLGKDVRIKLYLREHVATLHEPQAPLQDPTCIQIRELLKARGGLFFQDIQARIDTYPPTLIEALWKLVRNGEVSNDTMLPLRSMRRAAPQTKRKRGRRRRPRMMGSRTTTKGTQGRWWLVSECLSQPVTETERALAIASTLLERYGVLCREAFGSEGLKGGFSKYYSVLKALEERGRVRRGYFVDSLGATQFAVPGLEQRLRKTSKEEATLVWLSIIDPAQPYGSLFDWPSDFPIRPIRNAGNQVLLCDGEVIAVSHGGGTKLLVRTPDDAAHEQRVNGALIQALPLLPARLGRGSIFLEHINGSPAATHPIASQVGHSIGQISGTGLQVRTAAAAPTSSVRDAVPGRSMPKVGVRGAIDYP